MTSFHKFMSICIHNERIFQEFSRETTENQNVFTVSLYHTSTLSISEKFLTDNIDQLPFLSVSCIVFFDWVYVFSCLIVDSTKNINCLIIESTWAVIMSTNIQVWHFKPKIDIRVVHFTFYLWTVFFFSGAWNHNELISKPASWVAMSWMFHLISFDKSEIVLCLDLKKRIKCILIFLIVSTTNHVKLTFWPIYTLKVMWERCLIS